MNVPVPDGSVVDLVTIMERDVTRKRSTRLSDPPRRPI